MIVINGILELVTSLTCSGDSVYTIEIENSSGEGLYSLLGDYEGKKVRLTVEEIK